MDAAAKVIFPPTPFFPNNSKSHHPKLRIFFLAVVAISLLLYLLLASKKINSPRFIIIIDAGSTGTRLRVYGYTISPETKLPLLNKALMSEMKINPGLSSYLRDPASAGASLDRLLDFGKGKVPRDLWGDTQIRLMATAGLRMLDDGVREKILDSCRMVLKSSGFRFQPDWASMISGSEEGAFAWVAANYALGKLGGDPQETTGIIELGGASAQLTFATSESLPSELSQTIKFGGATYNLYSNSFLGLGQNAAHESVKELRSSGGLNSLAGVHTDPCSPAGNFSECKAASLTLLQGEKNSFFPCLGSNSLPDLQGRFLATENFFYTSEFFELGPMAVLSDFESAGQRFCKEDAMKLKSRYHSLGEDDLSRHCFSSAYIVALLHDCLGISMDNDKRLLFSNEVNNIQLEWSLGAFILIVNDEEIGWVAASLSANGNLLELVGMIALCSVASFAVCLILRLRKPQLKTIYDLEKGHYIVTKVSR